MQCLRGTSERSIQRDAVFVCVLILQILEFTFILFFDGLFTLCGKAKDAGVIDCWR